MEHQYYTLTVGAENQAASGRSTTALADVLREADGVLEVVRSKVDGSQTMDLGAIVSIVATSGATLAIARGLAAWLRARRSVTLTVEKDGKAGSLKTTVSGLDPEAAVRIIEIVRQS